MSAAPRRMPATSIAFLFAVIIVSWPFVFHTDIVALEIKFLQVLEIHHLDNIVIGLIMISIGIAVDRAQDLRRSGKAIQESQKRLEEAVLQFVETMAEALDARDKYTAGHSNRVSINSTAVAQAIGLSRQEVEIVTIGGRLHDIGKIGIPDSVLQKPGKLTDEEYALIKRHPQLGKKILDRVEKFQEYLPIVELHHEDYDGGGYPYCLKGPSILLGVRIVHVAGVFDAITSNRAYRKAMSREDVLATMTKGSGTQFDPAILEVFLDMLNQGKLVQAGFETGMDGRESSGLRLAAAIGSSH